MRPFHTQITGFTHHCSCQSSHLSPHLNFLNLPSSTLLFVHDAIFQSKPLLPRTEWPRWKSSSYASRPTRTEKSYSFRLLCCHLSPQFQPLRGSHLRRMDSASPCWHHTRTQQLLDTHFHVTLLNAFFLMSENLTLHFFPPRFSCAHQPS